MDKHKTISVRMNGKDTTIQKRKAQNEPLPPAYHEQAATIEHQFTPDDLIEYEKTERSDVDEHWFAKKTKRSSKLPQGFKVFLIAAISATVIGITLGMIMLKMFANIDDNEQVAFDSTNTTEDKPAVGNNDGQAAENGNNSGQTAAITVNSLQGVVIQGGVFSTYDKAEVFQQQFKDAGMPAMIWDNGEDFRLFAGLSTTEQGADATAAAIAAAGIEAYVRTWDTESKEINGSPELNQWLKDFSTYWQESVSLLESENSLTGAQGNWETWLNESPSSSSVNIEQVKASGQQLVEHIKGGDEAIQLQIDLLELWQSYSSLNNQ